MQENRLNSRLQKPLFLGMMLYFMLCFCTGCSVQPFAKQKIPVVPQAPTDAAKKNTKPADNTAHFNVLGKASLSDGKRHAQISLRWQQRGEYYVIHLYGPLGSGAVRLSNAARHPSAPAAKTAKHAQAHRLAVYYQDMKGEVRSYGSAEKLLEKECGWRLPIAGLEWWLRSLPRPEAAAIVVGDKAGRTTQIEQDGWTIEYLSYQSIAKKTYPHKVRLSRDKHLLKFVLREWHIDTKTPA